jgi:hypothetical protein
LINPATDVLLAFAFFAVIWFGVFNLVAFLGGWTQLARSYRASTGFEGKRWWMQSGMGRFSVHYGNCLLIGANLEGLRIAVFFPFRPGHPPLFFPWSDISITYERRWLARWACLHFSEEQSVSFYLPERLAQKIGDVVSDKGLTS